MHGATGGEKGGFRVNGIAGVDRSLQATLSWRCDEGKRDLVGVICGDTAAHLQQTDMTSFACRRVSSD